MSTYDLSTPYTTLPHNLIKDKLIDLIERPFKRGGSPYLACNDRNAFLLRKKLKKHQAWSCQNVCDALADIFVGQHFYLIWHQDVQTSSWDTYGHYLCSLVSDLFLFCYERYFMMPLSGDKQADVIDAFNTTPRYLDNILNIDNVYFDNMVSQIYP